MQLCSKSRANFFFYVLLTASLYNLVNKANLVHNFSWYVYFFSLHVLGYCLGCKADSHPHRVTNTKCRIDTVISPDDGHTVARSMYRKNKHTKRNCEPIWIYLQDYTGCTVNRTLKKT
jgi:hypothetical protein